MQRSQIPAALLVALFVSAPTSTQNLRAGGELLVNSYTSGGQFEPDVAADPSGTFVVVWTSFGSAGTDLSATSVQVRRFDSAGVPLAPDFQVNTYTMLYQRTPSVAVGSTGEFVVVWQSDGSADGDTEDSSVQARRFGSDGNPIGGQFQVNSYTTGEQGNVFSYRRGLSVAKDGSDNFVVVWQSDGSAGTDTSSWSVQGRRYASDGTPVGAQFQVNSGTTSSQRYPEVSASDDGSFVVVWKSFDPSGVDTYGYSIQGQRFSSSGSFLGSQFLVNDYTTGQQAQPAVAMAGNGSFVVLWHSYGSGGTDGDQWSIQGRRYASDGSALGGQFQVNTYTPSSQRIATLDMESGGAFVVVWRSNGSAGTDDSQFSVQAQRYASTGTPIGNEFQVNTYTTNGQTDPSVATGPDGAFVVVWHSYGSSSGDSSATSIHAQRYAPTIFTDGFESGSTTAWSNSVP